MNIAKLKTPFLSGITLFLTFFSAQLQAEWSANAGVTSDYLFRGITQTLGAPAVSGGIDYEHESGFYVSGWVSNVDFGAEAELGNISIFASAPSVEADIILGYAGTAGEDDIFGYDVNFSRYWYPDALIVGADYGELIFNFNASDFIFGMAYTAEAQTNKGTFNEVGDLYYYLGYSGEYDEGWSFSIIYGFQSYTTSAEEESDEPDNFIEHSFVELVASKSTDFGDFSLSLTRVLEITSGAGKDDDFRPMPVISWVMYF